MPGVSAVLPERDIDWREVHRVANWSSAMFAIAPRSTPFSGRTTSTP